LVAPNLTQRYSTRTETMRLLNFTQLWAR
jgi:hypothetical protein